jgi:imidazolonepropionase-like amidohydrolase
MFRKAMFVLFLLTSFAIAQQKAAAAKSLPTLGRTVVLRGAKLLTITHGTIENGVLVMENGKIAAIGAAASTKIPANAQVIDVTGMTIYPGLIDSESNLGLTEISAEEMTNDLVETSDEIMPHMHTWEAFHAESALIPVTRANGVLNAVVAPESKDTLPGQDTFIQLAGASASEMILVKDVAMPLNFIGDVRRNESFEKAKYPQTRMGMAAQLRQVFIDAQDYQQRLSDYDRKKGEWDKSDKSKPEPASVKRDLKLEALLPYLQGKRPVVVAANEASDVQTAVQLAQEFKLKIVLNHLTHSQSVLDYVASLKLPVIVGPIYEDPKEDERYDSVYSLPAQLQKRGVKVIFASYDSHQSRNLPYAAGYSVAFGMPYEEALKGVTLYPAEVWGVADQLGSLDVGKLANVVVANGDPLDVKTDIKRIFIQGQEVSTANRQSRLRDEYSK